MDDATAKCRSCGAELQGRDIYEGVCKTCREEAALGEPAAKRRPRSPERRPPPPLDAIAIEASVDLEADTKEMSPEERAAEEAARRAAQIEPASEEPSEPASEAPPEAPADSDVIPFSLGPSDGSPPPAAAEARPSKVPAAHGPTIRHFEKTLASAPDAGSAGGIKRSYESFHGDSAAPGRLARPSLEPPPAAPELGPEPIVPPRPMPRIEAPPSGKPEPTPSLEPSPPEPEAKPSPEPVVAQPLPWPQQEAPAPEAPPMARVKPAEAAPAAAADALRLRVDALEGRIKVLLDDFAGQVEQLSKVLSSAYQVSPNPFWFGFKAFLGFLVGLGAVVAAALGLLALAALFYPPAFDLLRQLFGGSGPR